MKVSKRRDLKAHHFGSLEEAAECLKTLRMPTACGLCRCFCGALHGRRTSRGLWDSKPHGVRTFAAHATMRTAHERKRGAKGVLSDR